MIKIELIFDLYDIFKWWLNLIKFLILSGSIMFTFFLTFSWHYSSLKLKSKGTIDIEVAAKLALGAGKQEDLEQERLELQVTRMIYVCSYVRSERRRERETCFPVSFLISTSLTFFSWILSATFSLWHCLFH